MSSFEDEMKDAFEGAEFAPSEKVWAVIESAIAPKKKKGILFMWQTYGVAAGILLATTFGFLWNDGFFTAGDPLTTKKLAEEAKGDGLATPADSLDTVKIKPKDLNSNTLASSSKEPTKLKDKEILNNGLNNGNEATLKLQAQNAEFSNKTEGKLIDPIVDATGLNTVVANLKSTDEKSNPEILKSNSDALKASELLLNSKLNTALKSSTEVTDVKDPVKRDPLSEEKSPLKSTITADLSTASETAMRIQSAVNPGRQNSVSGSLGNNVLNISSGLGAANSISESNLRDPNTFNALSATVDNTEGEALGAISAGFGASFDIGKRLSLSMSLRYSEFKFRNTSNAYSVEDGISLPIYIPVGYNSENVFFVGTYDVVNTIQSIFLQTGIGYKIATLGKFDFSLQAGIGLDYFLAYKVKGELNFLETRKVNPRESNFLSSTNLSGISGFSVNYRMSPQFGLSLDLTYRKFISGGDLASSQPSSVLGFGMSVNYILGKKEE